MVQQVLDKSKRGVEKRIPMSSIHDICYGNDGNFKVLPVSSFCVHSCFLLELLAVVVHVYPFVGDTRSSVIKLIFCCCCY